MALITFLFLQFTRQRHTLGHPLLDENYPGREPARSLSRGAVGLLVVGFFFAVSGAVLHFLPSPLRNPWPPVVLTAGLVGIALSVPDLLLRWRRTVGKSLVAPGFALALLGATFWIARDDTLRGTTWRGAPNLTSLCDAGTSAYRLGRWGTKPPSSLERTAHSTAAAIEKEILELGEPGVRGVLDYRHHDCWWTKELLIRFGPRAVPALIDAIDHPYQPSRVRATSVLAVYAHDPAVARAMVAALSDPTSLVRAKAVEFFTDAKHERGKRPPAVRTPEAIPALKELLWDRDSYRRQGVLRALRHQDPNAGWPEVADLLQIENDKHAREEALLNLARVGIPEAFRTLVENMDDGTDVHVASELPELGSESVEILIDLLDTSSEDRAHGFLRSSDLFGPLTLKENDVLRLIDLASGADIERRRTALHVLSQLKDPQAVRVAREALRTPEAAWVVDGLRSRGVMSDSEFLEVARERFLDVSDFYAPGPKDRALIPFLSERARDGALGVRERYSALGWLERIDEAQARQTAERILREGGGDLRGTSLLRYLPPEATKEALRSEEADLNEAALWSLREETKPVMVPELLHLVEHGTSDRARRGAIRLLGQWKVKAAIPAISRVTLHAEIPERPRLPRRSLLHASLTALGQIGDASTRELLRDVLRRAEEANSRPIVRSAATALGMTGDPEVIPILRDAIRWPHYGRGCSCRSRISCRAALALSRLGETGVDQLLEVLLERESTDIAAEMLGRSGSARAREPLLALLADSRPRVRKGAALGLGFLGVRQVVPALNRVLEDPVPDVADAALWAKETLTGEGQKTKLMDGLRHGAERVESAEPEPRKWIRMGPKALKAWRSQFESD